MFLLNKKPQPIKAVDFSIIHRLTLRRGVSVQQAGLLALVHHHIAPSRQNQWQKSGMASVYSGGTAQVLHLIPYSPSRAPAGFYILCIILPYSTQYINFLPPLKNSFQLEGRGEAERRFLLGGPPFDHTVYGDGGFGAGRPVAGPEVAVAALQYACLGNTVHSIKGESGD